MTSCEYLLKACGGTYSAPHLKNPGGTMPRRMVAKREMPMVAKAGSVVRVGEGRGFIVEARDCRVGRLVVTAAHCLPYLPPAHPSSYTEERTYGELLGSLDEAPTLAAECIFVDP